MATVRVALAGSGAAEVMAQKAAALSTATSPLGQPLTIQKAARASITMAARAPAIKAVVMLVLGA